MAEQQKDIKKIVLQTRFVKIELSDPNILDELNRPGKYPQNTTFEGLLFNINKTGGRIVLKTEDKKGIFREIHSGVSRKETQEILLWDTQR